MNTYIILLRGVNVGGKNILPMKVLRILLEDASFVNVKTYIQSGNIVLVGTKNPESDVNVLIQSKFGFTPQVLVLSEDEFDVSVVNNPYQECEGKSVHFYFCKDTPKIDFSKLKGLASKTEYS